MSIARFHCPVPLASGERLILPDAVARHAVAALRLRTGDTVILFNGDGVEYLATLHCDGKQVAALLGERRAPERESPLEITLAQGISSGERMDYTLQKAVELGVTHIQPVLMRRTVVRLDSDKRQRRQQHWQAVAISACEQCGRNRIPEVAPILDFEAWIVRPRSAGVDYMLDPEGTLRLHARAAPEGRVCLLAGPEGGFDPGEREIARTRGFQPLRLGPRILRTETAAVAALAAFQALWGDL